MIQFFAASLLAVTLNTSNLRALEARLPNGVVQPTPGAACGASGSYLGTSNVSGNGKRSSVINIWKIQSGSGSSLGYIVRAEDRSLWYEDPMGFYVRITAWNVPSFLAPRVKYKGCFTKDLAM